MGLSSFASKPVEEVCAANPRTFFQMYWVGSRDRILQRAERARAAGAKGLIVTLDWTFATRRDWGSPPIPEKMDLKAIVQFAPEGIRRPRYVLQWPAAAACPT
jgi:L-lactate dehydrogenase (cytochrome)